MAARDGASSVQGTFIRVTKLLDNGDIDTDYPVLVTKGFISASFSPQFEDGDEITEKAADGSVCISYKGNDSLTRLDFSLSLCSPDPEVTQLLAGGCIIRDDDGAVVGYTSVPVGSAVGNPVAVEIWSIANIGGKPASDKPYWHWVFPYVKVRYDGDREFTNGALSNEFSGQALGNSALAAAGLNPANPADDYVVFREALVNPFTYVRTTGQPDSEPLFDGSFPESACIIDPYLAATGVTPGEPGSFTPSGATVPYDLAALQDLGALGETTAWDTGEYVVLGDSSFAYWDGDGWVAGTAP